MNRECVFIEDNEVFLSSFLDETAFGRTDLGKLISSKGILATVDKNGKAEISDWSFSENRMDSEGFIRFEGKAFNSTSLLHLFNENNNCTEKTLCVLKVLDQIVNDESVTIPGPGGILVSDKKDDGSFDVLVLPGELFDRCAENSKDYAAIQGLFHHKGLSGVEANIFTRAVIAYRAAASTLPFTALDLSQRQSDFYDNNFIPVKYYANGIDEKLAESIDEGLSVKNKKKIIPGEKRFDSEKEEKERLKTIETALSFSTEKLESFLNTPESSRKITDKTIFEQQRNKFYNRQQKILKIHRFYKRNNKRIWGTLAAAAVILYGLNSFHKSNMELATTRGLTSRETVETLFTAIHHTKVPVLQQVVQGKDTKSLVQKVSGFYVVNRQHEANDMGSGTCTPGQWLSKKGPSNYWQFGITNLTIDEEKGSTDFKYKCRKDKPAPLLEQDGRLLKKGDEISHKVTYNLVYNEGDHAVAAIRAAETVTLRWNGKAWLVKSIKGKARTNSYKLTEYKADWLNALETASGDTKKAGDILREKYSFVPEIE